MRYFHVRGRHSRKTAAISVVPEYDELAFWDDLTARRSAASWVPPTASPTDGNLVDWSPSNLLPRLCSVKLKCVFDMFSDRLVWLPVNVETPKGNLAYFILHFMEFDDLIDADKSIFVNGRLFKTHLSARKVADRSIFAIKPLSTAVIVNDDLKKAITAARCTGIEFEHCACS